MQIQFIKNIQFTRLIKADGHLREFNFRKLTGFQKDGVWKIVHQPLPEWVIKNETVFNDIIEEELRAA